MAHTSNQSAERTVPAAEADDPLGRVEHEFAMLMVSENRFRQKLNSSRIDRIALIVLGTLARCGPSRLTTVAERAGFDASHVSRQVADLEKAGLLSRAPDPEDRRAVLLQATGKGRSLMRRLAQNRRRRMERLLADWDPADVEIFGRLLHRLNLANEKYGEQDVAEMERELNNG